MTVVRCEWNDCPYIMVVRIASRFKVKQRWRGGMGMEGGEGETTVKVNK